MIEVSKNKILKEIKSMDNRIEISYGGMYTMCYGNMLLLQFEHMKLRFYNRKFKRVIDF